MHRSFCGVMALSTVCFVAEAADKNTQRDQPIRQPWRVVRQQVARAAATVDGVADSLRDASTKTVFEVHRTHLAQLTDQMRDAAHPMWALDKKIATTQVLRQHREQAVANGRKALSQKLQTHEAWRDIQRKITKTLAALDGIPPQVRICQLVLQAAELQADYQQAKDQYERTNLRDTLAAGVIGNGVANKGRSAGMARRAARMMTREQAQQTLDALYKKNEALRAELRDLHQQQTALTEQYVEQPMSQELTALQDAIQELERMEQKRQQYAEIFSAKKSETEVLLRRIAWNLDAAQRTHAYPLQFDAKRTAHIDKIAKPPFLKEFEANLAAAIQQNLDLQHKFVQADQPTPMWRLDQQLRRYRIRAQLRFELDKFQKTVDQLNEGIAFATLQQSTFMTLTTLMDEVVKSVDVPSK